MVCKCLPKSSDTVLTVCRLLQVYWDTLNKTLQGTGSSIRNYAAGPFLASVSSDVHFKALVGHLA